MTQMAKEMTCPSPEIVDERPADVVHQKKAGMVAWLRRLGVAGFLFFFLKGLAWLAVPALLAKRAID